MIDIHDEKVQLRLGDALAEYEDNPEQQKIMTLFLTMAGKEVDDVETAIELARGAMEEGGITSNTFCPTGKGGGIDPHCSPHGAKTTPTIVGKAEHVHSATVEKEIAAGVGGKWEEDNAAYDVLKVEHGIEHGIEVKSMQKGSKKKITVHDDALLRKVNWTKGGPNRQFHTVAVDERATYGGGAYKDKYSGHRLYYKRGCRDYKLKEMHPVKDMAELTRLLGMKSNQLPPAARGSLPTNVRELKVKAERAHVKRLSKDRDRKARLKAAGKSAYTRVT